MTVEESPQARESFLMDWDKDGVRLGRRDTVPKRLAPFAVGGL